MNTPKQKQIANYMLDTVALKLTYPEFRVTNPNLFTPAFIIQSTQANLAYQYGHNMFKTFKQNPTLQDRQEEFYKPRLTAYQRFNDTKTTYDLHIELSIPKLLFGQSLQELDDNDFKRTVGILKLRLQRMGIEVTEDILSRAIVVKAHFGKNIPLPSPLTAQDAISELYKADVGKGKDVNIRHYVNGGQALYFYASSGNIIFYDKLRDIATPKNKAVDKDKLRQEKLLIQGNKNEQELLRFEVRLVKQQSLDAFLSKSLGEKIKNISFERVFNQELCQKVLLKSLEEIIATPASQLALKMDRPSEEVFDAIIGSYIAPGKKKAHSLNKALQDFAIHTLVNKCGARKIRDKIEKNWTKKSWTRLSEKMGRTAENLKDLPAAHTISDIQIALNKFDKYDWKPDTHL